MYRVWVRGFAGFCGVLGSFASAVVRNCIGFGSGGLLGFGGFWWVLLLLLFSGLPAVALVALGIQFIFILS